ncbi:putative E3 ubiquitin-protein ligase herc3 [Phytophthora boehmeriae]|uniref:Putative E3 ubiquitin-protein ligase herc3 n=1 Tax=Phytophthora boehmeriae TaxID=109152 RepID=A0A8T1WST2_9STRA|nr:putative E3 ubiquitin-protein ligase herc3 [Phytophthora boehmeriae]
MDPDHATCYAQAQVELRELFHELECNGQVSAAELQRSLAPFTAGDVKRDLLELLAELKRKRQSLDESEFLRVMWRKMYLSSAVDATKGAAAGQNKPINVSLAHVIVSVKRRRQLKQFATYYASRGISGADHLTTPSKAPAAAGKAFNSPPKGSPQIRKDALSPLSRGQQQTDLHSRELPAPPETDSSVESVVALRRRHSPCYDVVACVYDSKRRELRTQMVLTRARSADVRNCSHLYCLLFTREAGNFVLGCTHFGDSAKLDRQKEIEERGIVLESDNDLLAGSALCRTVSWADRDEDGLLMIRMEEYDIF